MTRWSGLALRICGATAVLAGCRVESVVTVEVQPDTSGVVTVEVTLDAEATDQLGDPVKELELDDLTADGWTVRPPTVDDDGTTVSASKAFVGESGLASVMAELGSDVVTDVGLNLTDGFGSTSWKLGATLSAPDDLSAFSDPDVTAALDGLPLGRTAEELERDLGAEPSVPLTFRVELPGGIDEASGGTEVDGSTHEWTIDLADGPRSEQLALASSSRSIGPWLLVILAATAAIASVILLLWRRSLR